MNKLKKILKMVGLIIGGILLLILIAGTLFLNLNPAFGGKPNDAQKQRYKESGLYSNGKFKNQIPTSLDMKIGELASTMIEFAKGGPDRQPSGDIPVSKLDSLDIVNHSGKDTRLTWFGHSTFLLEMDSLNILIDPMFSSSPAPHRWLGPKRFSKQLPIEIEELPKIDAVLISHDHYDHLDYNSILKLKDKVGEFYVPLGVAPHLSEWGVDENKINELSWGDEVQHESLKLICAPARHFSGRGILDRNSTLWSSWIIEGSKKIYFSGDSGYGPHFKEIGEKYGPFDFAMLECGQYNTRWEKIHMMPEQSAQAAVDLDAEVMMPIHWGAFTLALHSWTDPVERVTAKADELGVKIATPIIGESVVLDGSVLPSEKWWEAVK
jgi:L-ascorbate metabolism protein UlaG (beta-lactamase superfamily)